MNENNEIKENETNSKINEIEIKENKETENDSKINEVNKNDESYYYKLIINRYSDYINDKEGKSMSTLKQMINPEDISVKRVISKLKKGLKLDEKPTLADSEILFLSKTIISYLSKIQTIYPKIQFWPTFEEINFIKLGDPMDKAIYGCSLFSALNLQCKIYGTEDNKHYIVFDISDKRYFYSIEDDDLYQGTKLDLLLTKGVKFKYAFDQEEYIMLD